MISKVNKNPAYRKPLAKLLAMIQLTLKGTPFIFQGQEIGSVNKAFQSATDLRDVESINLYKELREKSSAEDAFREVLNGSRDHARTPMQWSSKKNAGFTEGIPWIVTDADYKQWNVEKQLENEDSVLNFYRQLIQFRKEHKALIYGSFEAVNKKRKDSFTYYRRGEKEEFYVQCNLSSNTIKRNTLASGYELILSNYSEPAKDLRPYEANLYKV